MSDSLSRRSFLSLAGGAAAALAGLGLVGCGGSNAGADPSKSPSPAGTPLSGTVNCSGATSFQPLVEAAAKKFEDENPDVTIAITGGGSGQGLSDVRDGKAQIGRSDVFAEEKLDASDAAALTDHTVCVVGMGPIVNSKVDVDDLTTDQLKGIFTGQITDWSEVGGTAGKIQVIERKAGSGTRATFEAAALGGDKAPDTFAPVAEEDSSGTVVEKIQQTEGSISYLAFSYFDDTKFKALKVDGVKATADNVCNGTFKIWAYEHMYTKDADEATQAFIDYMMSDKVQGSMVEAQGFIPAGDMKVKKDASGAITNA
ncbi:phosphate ABC transporter substrate-binding protein [Tractidigestivibacter sp.]|uniref:phosphate ABC transporter substrate-binding protein n=1 Tax=Tractidigestivibacter sp. TaxID=2847320 RepID=UPI002A9189B2|nr:phosphate ABC transporter substrate-binding protein [Tractidigestivibacter sp.]MDY5272278.1 phosphate ABC transporter substrate-binding protein [Tractidigestivibacter sp.]